MDSLWEAGRRLALLIAYKLIIGFDIEVDLIRQVPDDEPASPRPSLRWSPDRARSRFLLPLLRRLARLIPRRSH